MDILSAFPNQTLLVIKFFIITLFVFYTIFALVIIKQVSLMTKTVQVGLDKSIKTASIIHFFAALGLLVFTIFA